MLNAAADTIALDTAKSLLSADAASVFGSSAVSAYPSVVFGRMEAVLRPNIFELSFGFMAAWLLFFLFVIFICWLKYKEISAVALYLFDFRKFLKVQPSQRWLNLLVFACFSLFTLALLTANVCQVLFVKAPLGIAFLVSLGGLVLFFLSKHFVCCAIQTITQQRMFAANILCTNVYTFFTMCFLIVTLFFVQTLVIPPHAVQLMYVQIAIVGIFLLYYFVKTLVIFAYEKIPFFFWLLYVGTIEVLPLAVIYKLIIKD